MKVIRKKSFLKSYKILPKKWQEKTDDVLQIFLKNPYDSRLRNHALRGKLLGLHAISVSGDLRIVYERRNNYEIIILIVVGTHNQVY